MKSMNDSSINMSRAATENFHVECKQDETKQSVPRRAYLENSEEEYLPCRQNEKYNPAEHAKQQRRLFEGV